MTLTQKNVFFKTGIAFCGISTVLAAAASFFVFPVYSSMAENTRRPAGVIQAIIGRFLEADYSAVHVSILLLVLFSIAAMIFIYNFFEQTPAPEILYIAIFVISFSFEIIRLLLPLRLVFDIPLLYLLIASRVLIFSRYFSLFSLFAASICAAGLDVQNARNIILAIFIATSIITFGVPIDTQNWDTGLNMIKGYSSMFKLLEAAVFLATVISFFVAVKVRGSKEYAYIGLGAMAAMTGRYFLLTADNWVSPFPGILLLAFGIWFICSKLHKMHLWM